jgi:hypothetical protein
MGKAVSKGLKYRAEVLIKELPYKFGKALSKFFLRNILKPNILKNNHLVFL